jgi:hypothetical protein
MSTQPRVTLELRTPRESEQTADAAAQLFSALPNPPHDIFHFWQPAPEFTFEFLNQGQAIYELLTVPANLVEYVTSQLTAAYPEILIKKLEHQPLDLFRPSSLSEGKTRVGEILLSSASFYPIKTFKELGEADSLAAVLSTLGKLAEGESALIQFRVRKARDKWKRSAHSAVIPSSVSATVTGAATATPSLPHPHKDAITHKITQPTFQVVIRVVAQAPTNERADQILHSLITAMTSFQSQTNSFVLRKPLIRKSAALEKTLQRQPRWIKQYLSVEELATLWHMPNKKLSTIRNIAWGKNLLGEPPEDLPTYTYTPENERQDLNLFARTEFKNQDQIFGIHKLDRRRHMYAIGKSGTGKSTLLANMIINDLKHGEGLAVVDPHGDLIETVLNYIPRHRINDVILFDPSDPNAVVKLNLFEAGTLVHRELIASGIVAIFQKLYANSWGPRLEYILRNALLTLLSQNAKLEDVLRILTDEKYRARVVENLDDKVLKNFWENEFNTMQPKLRSEAISPILNKVGQFVTSPLIRNVVNTNVSSFDIESVMNEGKILLVNVSQGKLGEDNMALLGSMIITKIQLAAMNRVYMKEEERRDFYLYIDEFQNFATTSFVKILSEARKYRLNLILANQYMAQIPDEVKAAIFGNAATMISFILGASDADWMMKEFGNKYTQEDLVSLGRYQVIAKLMIHGQVSHPFPATTLGLAASSNQNKEKVIKVSRERYARKK